MAGSEFPKIEVRIDGNVVGFIDVNTQSYSQPFAITANIRSGLRRVELKFTNDFYNASTSPVQDRNVYIKELLVYDQSAAHPDLTNPNLNTGTFPMQSVSLLTGFFGTNADHFGTTTPCDPSTRRGCRNIDFIKSIGATDITFTTVCQIAQDASWCSPQIFGPTPAETSALRVAIQYARSKGLTVTLKVHVLKDGNVLQLSSWRPANPAGFFNSIGTMLQNHAMLAREEGVSLLVIGAEMGGDYTSDNAFTEGCTRWQKLISDVRRKASDTPPLASTVNPPASLKLTYAATLAGYHNSLTANEAPYVCFWDRLDYIGLNAYHLENFADVCASGGGNNPFYATESAWKSACASASLNPVAKLGSGWGAYVRMFYAPAGSAHSGDHYNLGLYATYNTGSSSTPDYTVDKNFSMPLAGFPEFDISNLTTKPYETRYNTKYYSTKWYTDYVVDAINDRIRAANPNAPRLQAILTEVGMQSSFTVHGHWGSTAYSPPPITAMWTTYVDEQARAWDGYFRAFRKNPRIHGISVWGIGPHYDRTVPYSDRSSDWLVDFDFNGKRNGAGNLVTEEIICKWFKRNYSSGTCNSSP